MYTWIFGTGVVVAFATCFSIGSNDASNSIASVIGAKVLTRNQAIILGSIFEFAGAVFMGSHVTDAVRKNIISLDVFENNPGALMLGMLCSSSACFIWLIIATFYSLPVSTTHSIIGGIIGFGLAYGGSSVVYWDNVGYIVLSWIISPVLSGLFSFSLFTTINKFVFKSKNPYNNTLKLFPILTFFTLFINTLFIIYKGSPQLDLDEIPLWKSLLITFGISTGCALLAVFVYIPYVKKKMENEAVIENNNKIMASTKDPIEAHEDYSLNKRSVSYKEAFNNDNTTLNIKENKNFIYDDNKDIKENIKLSKDYINTLIKKNSDEKIELLHNTAQAIDPKSDKLCSWLQIITAAASAASHGSNDLSNGIAPFATIFYIYKNDKIAEELNVPIWLLVLGGAGIVTGLVLWSGRLIERMGRELTKITPSRGFIIELSAALTVIIASRAELPVSTSHCQVGSILGVGLGNGKTNVDWKLVKGIVFSWLITLPVTGLLSAALFSFGYYSPNEQSAFDTNNLMDNMTNSSGFSGSGDYF